VVSRLKAEAAARGKVAEFEGLKSFLTTEAAAVPCPQCGTDLRADATDGHERFMVRMRAHSLEIVPPHEMANDERRIGDAGSWPQYVSRFWKTSFPMTYTMKTSAHIVFLACPSGWALTHFHPFLAASLEAAPPVVVKTLPVAGSQGIDPALSEISVTFSKPMTDRSWSLSTWGDEN